MEIHVQRQLTRRERLGQIVTFPILWIGAYVLWLAFTGMLMFGYIGVPIRSPWALAYGVLVLLPPGLVALSHLIMRAYEPGRLR